MDDDSDLSDYPGEGEDLGEDMEGDFGETGQISPTQTSPERDSDYEHNRTDNIRNFMNQAQPAGGEHYPHSNREEITEDKEGGSLDELTQNENPYNNMTESSPEISKTDADQPSAYLDGDEPTSSFQDTPMSSMQGGDLNDVNTIQSLNNKAQQIQNHLEQMKQRERQMNEEESESLSPLRPHEL